MSGCKNSSRWRATSPASGVLGLDGAAGKTPESQARRDGVLRKRFTYAPRSQQKPATGEKDELADNAHQLWASLGGTDAGWKTWYGQRADELANLATLTWEETNQPLASFEIADLGGKTWGLASLRGKVTFLNFWAEW